jgi:hypothetical protein
MVETWECFVKNCRKPSVRWFIPLSRSSSTVHWGVPGQEVSVRIYVNMSVCLSASLSACLSVFLSFCLYIYICKCVCVRACVCSTARRILGILHLLIEKEKIVISPKMFIQRAYLLFKTHRLENDGGTDRRTDCWSLYRMRKECGDI